MSESRSEIKKVHNPIYNLLRHFINVGGMTIWYDKPSVRMGQGRSGQPDFIIFMNNWFIGCECKYNMLLKNGEISTAADRRPNANQTKRLREIKSNGGIGVAVDINNLDAFKDLLRMITLSHTNKEFVDNYVIEKKLDIEFYATETQEVTI